MRQIFLPGILRPRGPQFRLFHLVNYVYYRIGAAMRLQVKRIVRDF